MKTGELTVEVGAARATAVEWVRQNVSNQLWYRGAYFSGSTANLRDDEELSPSSDIDIFVITSEAEVRPKLGKFLYKEVLLEVTYLPHRQLQSAREVLLSYHLANSLRSDTIIEDPTGNLRKVQSEVANLFPRREWVYKRCDAVLEKIEAGLKGIDPATPIHDQAIAWLFSTGVTTHVILVAALRNPTVRLRYLAAKSVLAEYGYQDFYQELLEMAGYTKLSKETVKRHLVDLEETFNATTTIAQTPFPFSTDISHDARKIAIEGSYDLISKGHHREAMFWIAVTFARCHKILHVDALDELRQTLFPAFHSVLTSLGIGSSQEIQGKARIALHFLPKLKSVTYDIVKKTTS